jgi:hypothetical protein
VHPASTPEQARQDAIATVGTLLLARAAADPALANEIIDAGRAALLN